MNASSRRRRLARYLPCIAVLSTLFCWQSARASLSLAITGTNGATSFTVPSSGGSYQLVVFAMIQDDSTGTVDPNGNDGIASIEVALT